MNIYQFQDKVSKRLMRWSIGSIIAGFLFRFGGKFGKNLGNQFITWGAIDAIIAIGGQIAKRNRIDKMENPGLQDVKEKESSNLTKLLWLNAGLDMLYIIGGYLWAKRDRGDGVAKGNGIGVIIQGAFLLFFDAFHATNAPDKNN